MPTPSTLSNVLFCGIVLVVALFVVYALRRAAVGALPGIALLSAYLVIPAVLARIGALDRYDPLPAPALILVLALTLITVAITTFSALGARLTHAVPLGGIIALQAFRIPVEWVLHRLYLEGVIPVQMTYSGRNFDIITGITGLLLGGWLLSGRTARRGVVLAWNVVGLLLLVNIVTIAVLSTPVPFREFMDGPANLLPSTFPYVWLPSFLVQVALGSHLLVFRHLRQRTSR
ncbi:MAG: hypothetical protein ACREMQ_21135 [Longimicrobiales bacterium]